MVLGYNNITMARFGSKKKITDYFYTKPVIVFLSFIVILLGISVFERYQVEREMSARRIAAEEEYQELEQRREELNAKVDYLSGERGIEEEIRKHFDVAKEGEKVIILLGDDEEGGDEIAEPARRSKWYQFWQ